MVELTKVKEEKGSDGTSGKVLDSGIEGRAPEAKTIRSK